MTRTLTPTIGVRPEPARSIRCPAPLRHGQAWSSLGALTADPRHFQIAVLTTLLAYGVTTLDFGIGVARILVTVGAAVGTQWICERIRWQRVHRTAGDRAMTFPETQGRGLPVHGTSSVRPEKRVEVGAHGAQGQAHRLPQAPQTHAATSLRPARLDLRSPLITSLSLCLILRTDALWIAAAASGLAIGGKYFLRYRGKHVFNPANLGIAVFTLSTSHAWVSPGQWGSVALLGFALAGLGGLVVYRAARSDVTYAFLAGYAGALFARAVWLGDPWAIPLHQLSSGALLLFAFFMISDPKTTPNSRTGRVFHGLLVAGVALVLRFGLHEPDGLLWSLFFVSPLVPLWDRVFGGGLYRWDAPRKTVATSPSGADRATITHPRSGSLAFSKGATMSRKRRFLSLTSAVLGLSLLAESASAFCGFYVAKVDTQLFNSASQVVLVRDGDRTVITMASNYQGEASEFALVVPVPTVLQEEQIHVTNQSFLDHLDAYTSPRLVEYFDDDPCSMREMAESTWGSMKSLAGARTPSAAEDEDLGVTIEAKYTVGEYDILILSAEESGGLETWLRRNDYRIPEGASPVLGSYIKQGMKFFVAKVNLKERDALGFQNLRPIQVAFESPKFMLPLRLGTVNANGPQEMFVYALTGTGRVESVNYRTVKVPSDVEIPGYVKEDFGGFYTAMFSRQWEKEGRNVLFLEYAWDMNWCDPCAADPLSTAELRELGVYWVGTPGDGSSEGSDSVWPGSGGRSGPGVSGASGVPGASGVSGASGVPSASGVPGASGASGASGIPSASGVPGASGVPSASGVPGVSGNPPSGGRPAPGIAPPQQGQNVYVTRLHVRYDARTFPEDLVFRETGDRANYQGRYILRHPWTGEAGCKEAERYFDEVDDRRHQEAETLASLTGWELADILRDMEIPNRPESSDPWWKTIWK